MRRKRKNSHAHCKGVVWNRILFAVVWDKLFVNFQSWGTFTPNFTMTISATELIINGLLPLFYLHTLWQIELEPVGIYQETRDGHLQQFQVNFLKQSSMRQIIPLFRIVILQMRISETYSVMGCLSWMNCRKRNLGGVIKNIPTFTKSLRVYLLGMFQGYTKFSDIWCIFYIIFLTNIHQ